MPSVIVPATLEQLGPVNTFVRKHVPVGSECILHHVELAVEELLVNIFMYAYPDTPGMAEVGCRVVYLDEVPFFCVRICDSGMEFNPFKQAAEPNVNLPLEDRPQGGMGIFFVKQVAAHYSYSRSDGHNTIELYFSLPQAEPLSR